VEFVDAEVVLLKVVLRVEEVVLLPVFEGADV